MWFPKSPLCMWMFKWVNQWKHEQFCVSLFFELFALLALGLTLSHFNQPLLHLSHSSQPEPNPLLTCREAVPDLQPVVSAEGARRRRGVGLHVEAVKLHHDLRHLGGEDHESAVQVVGILLGEARCLDDASGSRKVPGTFWTCEAKRYWWVFKVSRRVWTEWLILARTKVWTLGGPGS